MRQATHPGTTSDVQGRAAGGSQPVARSAMRPPLVFRLVTWWRDSVTRSLPVTVASLPQADVQPDQRCTVYSGGHILRLVRSEYCYGSQQCYKAWWCLHRGREVAGSHTAHIAVCTVCHCTAATAHSQHRRLHLVLRINSLELRVVEQGGVCLLRLFIAANCGIEMCHIAAGHSSRPCTPPLESSGIPNGTACSTPQLPCSPLARF